MASKTMTLKQQPDAQQRIINTLEIKLKASIARANNLVRLVASLQAQLPKKPVIMPRRQNDNTWAVFKNDEIVATGLDFPCAAAKCRELATTH